MFANSNYLGFYHNPILLLINSKNVISIKFKMNNFRRFIYKDLTGDKTLDNLQPTGFNHGLQIGIDRLFNIDCLGMIFLGLVKDNYVTLLNHIGNSHVQIVSVLLSV